MDITILILLVISKIKVTTRIEFCLKQCKFSPPFSRTENLEFLLRAMKFVSCIDCTFFGIVEFILC